MDSDTEIQTTRGRQTQWIQDSMFQDLDPDIQDQDLIKVEIPSY